MKGPGVFLTAEWRNLLMLNYSVDPDTVRPFLPAGTEQDRFEGSTFLSLVGFEFANTRVAGVSIPFHSSFEEVNLRFYVRCRERRGVVFIRELVPKRAVAAVARLAFGENYSCVAMSHKINAASEKGAAKAEYSWGKGPDRCSMRIETDGTASLPADGSLGQFITEHYWGYTAQKNGGCLEYEVRHPRWQVWNATRAAFTGDATNYYGADFARVLMRPPDSAFLAAGSEVTVFKGVRIP